MSVQKMIMVCLVLLLSLASVSAITASIGNSRMVLRTGVGEEIERYVLVKNVNDVPVSVDIFPSGELADSVVLRDEMFDLAPGDEKRAYFTIVSDAEGTTESKINVRFSPEEGHGVGLSSTVIVIASDDVSEGDDFEELSDEITDEDISDEEGFSFNPSGVSEEATGDSASSVRLLSISSFVLIVVFVLLIVYATKVQKKKTVRGRHV